MLRLVGALCLLGGAGGFGFVIARGMSDRVANIRRMIIALQHLETEIAFAAAPLPLALTRAGQVAGGSVGAFLQMVADALARREGEPLPMVWQRLLREEQTELMFGPPEMETLFQLGAILGGSDREDQRKHLIAAQAAFIRCHDTMAARTDRARRIWQYLGFALGSMAVIILY